MEKLKHSGDSANIAFYSEDSMFQIARLRIGRWLAKGTGAETW